MRISWLYEEILMHPVIGIALGMGVIEPSLTPTAAGGRDTCLPSFQVSAGLTQAISGHKGVAVIVALSGMEAGQWGQGILSHLLCVGSSLQFAKLFHRYAETKKYSPSEITDQNARKRTK